MRRRETDRHVSGGLRDVSSGFRDDWPQAPTVSSAQIDSDVERPINVHAPLNCRDDERGSETDHEDEAATAAIVVAVLDELRVDGTAAWEQVVRVSVAGLSVACMSAL